MLLLGLVRVLLSSFAQIALKGGMGSPSVGAATGGGFNLALLRAIAPADSGLDPTEGINEYGESAFWSVRGGAHVGLMQLDPAGTSVIVCRLPSAEKNHRLVEQLPPFLPPAAPQRPQPSGFITDHRNQLFVAPLAFAGDAMGRQPGVPVKTRLPRHQPGLAQQAAG